MYHMKYNIVIELIRDADFVRRVQNLYEFNKEGNKEMVDHWLNKLWMFYQPSEESRMGIRKEIMYAKDLVVHYNIPISLAHPYGMTRSWSPVRGKIIDKLMGYIREYPRPTANDVYARDYEAERREEEYRWSCCLPYDCMHYENFNGYEIWTKVKNKSREDWSYGELANFTHAKQLKEFNFCLCEEQEYFPYDDCPRINL